MNVLRVNELTEICIGCYLSSTRLCCGAACAACRLDCEQSLRMVTRARKARARKSSEGSESRGDAGEKAGKEGGTAFSFEPDVFR